MIGHVRAAGTGIVRAELPNVLDGAAKSTLEQQDELAVFAIKPGPGAQPDTSWLWAYGWPSAWLALLIGEVLALSLSVDVKTAALVHHPSFLVRLLAEGGSLVQILHGYGPTAGPPPGSPC